MLEKLTATQLAEWQAMNTLDPLGEVRADFRFSFLASLMTNLVIRTHGKQGAKLTSVEDFAFEWGEDPRTKGTQTIEEMKEIFKTLAGASKQNETQSNRRLNRKPKRLRK